MCVRQEFLLEVFVNPMERSELTTTEELVRHFAPDLMPERRETRFTSHVVASVLSLTLAVVCLGAFKMVGPSMLAVLGGFLAAGGVVAELAAPRWYRSEVERFRRDLSASPGRLYEAIAAKFVAEIERQRARTIGPDSDWGRARRPLETAAQETARSLAYWEQRCAMDPQNDVAREQRETALRLRDKFQNALKELDARAQVLVTFFNECEARLAVLQYAKRDYDEARKLGVLSERADDIVSDAQRTLAAIGSAFLSEAIRVGNALGGLERVGWLSLVDTVSADRIETLADRILESSLHERDMLERLTKDVLP
jgi:hypothetical protein